MKKGIIYDIKEFALHDGPGIRTTVFLKGCPLRCLWCHNPEGLNRNLELFVEINKCTGCLQCIPDDCSFKLTGKCSTCFRCLDKCPSALRKVIGEELTSKQLADRILKNISFLKDGGVTFSGGEPLMQPDFLLETVSLLDIHKALQTSGYCEKEIFKNLIHAFDYVFFDIKHTDRDKHFEYCGVFPEKIFQNLEYLTTTDIPFVVRIPLIKDINDSKDNFKKIANLLKNSDNLLQVELLRYNEAAPAKYKMVNRKFTTNYHFACADSDIDISVFEKNNLNIIIKQ